MTRRRTRPSRSLWPTLLVGVAVVALAGIGWHAMRGGSLVPSAVTAPSIVGTWVSDEGMAVKFTADGLVYEGGWDGETSAYGDPWEVRRANSRVEYGERAIRHVYREGDRLRIVCHELMFNRTLRRQ